MKSKKKLLIAMAAMSAAAIGAGTVSTFAWYNANATVALVTADTTGTLSAQTNGSITGIDVTLTYTANTVVGDGNTPDLTNEAGVTQYINGGVRDATTPDPIGVFSFKADWGSTTAENKTAMLTHVYKAYISGAGHIRVLKDDAANASDASGVAKEAAGSTVGYAVYIKNDDGTLKLSRDNSAWVAASTGLQVNYAVRTNNPYGLEVAATTTANHQVAGTLVSDGTVAVEKGAAFVEGGKYYVAKDAIAAATNSGLSLTNTTYFEEITLHSEDAITVSAGDQIS